MKATKISLIAILGIVLFLFVACTEAREESVKISLPNLTIKGGCTEIIEEKSQPGWLGENLLIVTGKVAEITYRPSSELDILVFEDGVVISADGAENFVWQLGKIHKVTMRHAIGGLMIIKVQIVD